MKLKELIRGLENKKVADLENVEVAGIAYDSRKVKEGYLFVAMRGHAADGHNYIKDAIDRGAVALVLEKKDLLVPFGVPRILVEDARSALAVLASTFYGNPSGSLKVAGITGTNGKTTTAYLIRSVAEAAGGKWGLVGTISYQIGERTISSFNTTPESLDLQELMQKMIAEKCTGAVMEVSSHGAEQGRISGINFDTGIFTNIAGHEHLDYHRTFRQYLEAKLKFFEKYLAESGKQDRTGIVNLDDACAKHFLAALKNRHLTCITYGRHPKAEVRLLSHQCRKEGNSLEVETAGTRQKFFSRLRGQGNIYNALAAIAFAWREGIPAGAVRNGLEKVETVPGRFEFVNEGQPYEVIVDYAHTHHALNNLLDSVQDLRPARIILVFGCGGDRDRSKRPLMGKVAVQKADLVIITSDNPRSEEPLAIISDIERGIPFWLRKKYVVLADRRAAIQEAISFSRPQDCVVIAGKGHETYQILKNTIIPFDDREEARKAIRERKAAWSR